MNIHGRVQPESLVDYRPQISHLLDISVRRRAVWTYVCQYFRSKTLQDVGVHAEKIHSYGQGGCSLWMSQDVNVYDDCMEKPADCVSPSNHYIQHFIMEHNGV